MKTRHRLLSPVIAFFLAFNFVLVVPPEPAHAATIYRVIPGGATSGACGGTWANGCDLQYSLATLSASGDELWVKTGTYKPTTTTDRYASFYLKNGVSLYGGFAGFETSRTGRNWQSNPTTLSGDIGTPNVASDNSYHVVRAVTLSTPPVLDGFTITGGNANGFAARRYGGGMYVEYGSPIVNNVTFNGNHALLTGGGMYNYYGFAALTNVTFLNNTADSDGGGMYETGSRVTLNGVTFINNWAVHAGGGMADVNLSSSTLNGVTFSNNHADFGGGMWIDGLSPGFTPSLTKTRFNGNTATSRGGGLYVYDSVPVLTNAIFFANSAAQTGGGIGNYAGGLTLTNTTFWGNTAPTGGALYNFGSDISGGGTSLVQNSLLWGSTGGEIYNETASGSTSTVAYSIVQGCNPGGTWNAACGTNGGHNPADADPLFLNPQDGYLLLIQGSPAVDAGNDALVSPGATDITGGSRLRGTHVDLGAYEFSLLFVDQQAAGANNGSSWANAYSDLQSALAAATADCEVWVAEGTYKPSSTGDQSASFHLKNGVLIYGGFAGTETTREQRDPAANLTILSGDLNGDDGPNFANYGDNSQHVTYAADVDTSALIDGFTIRGGNWGAGGGMQIDFASPTLKHLVFLENQADYGGGINTLYSNPTITSVTFSGNKAGIIGGGMYAVYGYPVLDRVIFSGNTSGEIGGGMANFGSIPTVTNTLFTGNRAPDGGGMYNLYGSFVMLTNVTFSGNSADTGQGGGIHNTHGGGLASSAVIRNSILWGDFNGEVYNDPAGPPSTATIAYSLVQGCSPGGAWNAACGTDGGHNLADADPRFVNTGYSANLHLRAASPAVDMGDNLSVGGMAADLDGRPRIHNGAVDLGAYEYQNEAPLVASFFILTFAEQDVHFTLSHFTDHFTDANGDALASIRITALPDHGILSLGVSPVVLNQEIPAGSIGELRLTPPAGWSGLTSFTWTASDGQAYASSPAAVMITLTPPIDPGSTGVFLPLVVR